MRQLVAKSKRAFAKTLCSNSTDAETTPWRLLRSRRLSNLNFRRQVPIGKWIVDFVSFEHRLIVEADGSQHANSVRDVKRDDDLVFRGFHILRVWHNDVIAKRTSVAEAIFVAAEPSPSPGGLRPPPSPTRGEGRSPSV